MNFQLKIILNTENCSSHRSYYYITYIVCEPSKCITMSWGYDKFVTNDFATPSVFPVTLCNKNILHIELTQKLSGTPFRNL